MDNLASVLIVAFLADNVGQKFFSIQFASRKDGEIRTYSNCRLNAKTRMADGGNRGTNARSDLAREVAAKNNLVPFVDMTADEGKGWRSFGLETVLWIKCGEFEAGNKVAQ